MNLTNLACVGFTDVKLMASLNKLIFAVFCCDLFFIVLY